MTVTKTKPSSASKSSPSAPTKPTTLLELCEPLFQLVCQSNRSAHGGAMLDYEMMRRETEDAIADLRNRANKDGTLATLYEDMELNLIFFVDYVMSAQNGPFEFRDEWNENRMAYERAQQTGDKKFFEELDRILKDKSEGATQKIAVFYTCMGLGMAGKYEGQPEYLRRKMSECNARLRGQMDAATAGKMCAEAYEANTDDLIVRPGKSLMGLTIVLIGMMVVLLVAYVGSFKERSAGLDEDLKTIVESSPKVSPAAPPAPVASAQP